MHDGGETFDPSGGSLGIVSPGRMPRLCGRGVVYFFVEDTVERACLRASHPARARLAEVAWPFWRCTREEDAKSNPTVRVLPVIITAGTACFCGADPGVLAAAVLGRHARYCLFSPLPVVARSPWPPSLSGGIVDARRDPRRRH